MMMMKNPSSLFPSLMLKTSSISSLLCLNFSSTSQDQNPSTTKSNFIIDYLISSLGFSPSEAITASKYIAYVTSPEKPDSVRHFLKHNGFTDANVRKLISLYPRILCAGVDSAAQANVDALRRLGFTDDEFQKVIACSPQALFLRSTIPHIEFWKDFFNGNGRKLFRAFTGNRGLMGYDIKKNVVPKISLLTDHGLSLAQIRLVLARCGLFKRSTTSMEVLLKRALKLGFLRGSPMFVSALSSLNSVGTDTFEARMELFLGFGWTNEDFVAALNKHPGIITISEESLRKKMGFLVDRAGCTQSYIASRPVLLRYSLEKRLTPRFQVAEILKKNELVKAMPSLSSIMTYSNKTFIEKFVLPYEEMAPNLHEMYAAACKGLTLIDGKERSKAGD